jgi:hypothetical protein
MSYIDSDAFGGAPLVSLTLGKNLSYVNRTAFRGAKLPINAFFNLS